jgi:hypothetical protein
MSIYVRFGASYWNLETILHNNLYIRSIFFLIRISVRYHQQSIISTPSNPISSTSSLFYITRQWPYIFILPIHLRIQGQYWIQIFIFQDIFRFISIQMIYHQDKISNLIKSISMRRSRSRIFPVLWEITNEFCPRIIVIDGLIKSVSTIGRSDFIINKLWLPSWIKWFDREMFLEMNPLNQLCLKKCLS